MTVDSRFTGWNEPKQITVRPNDPDVIEVGSFQLEEDHNTIWFKVTYFPTDDSCQWPWSYGLLSWVSAEGRELGTVKVFGNCEGEIFRLGTGRSPVERTGNVRFYPRHYNLAWINNGHPWTLQFEAESGIESGTFPDLPSFGTRATLGVLSDLIGFSVSYAVTGSEKPYALIKLLNR